MKNNIHIVFFIFLLLVGSALYSQSIDSLKIELNNAKQDSTRCKILNTMIEIEADDQIWPKYNDQLKSICEKNLVSSPTLNKGTLNSTRLFYLKYLASALNNVGYFYNTQGNTTKALDYFHKSLLIQEEIKDQKGIAESLNNIGVIYQNQSDILQALECYHRSLRIQENIKDKGGIASSLNNIGAIYQNQNNNDKALEFFNKSLKIQEEINDKIGIAYTLNNIGRIYDSKNDIQKALEYHYQSLNVRKAINDKVGIANSLNNIGAIYVKQSESNSTIKTDSLLKKALDCHEEGLKHQKEIGDKKGIAYSLNSIAGIQLKLNQIELALQNAKLSLHIAQELGYPISISVASKLLSEIYAQLGSYKEAFEMQLLYKQMADSLNNEINRKAAIQKSFQYIYGKKSAADSVRVIEERKVFDVQIKQEKTQRTALYIGIGLIALFTAFIYNRFRITRKQKEIIELQKTEVDKQRELADSRRDIAESQKEIIEEKQKEILDSIHYAKRIQQAMLTSESYFNDHLKADCFIFYKPKDIVSGDFYWAIAQNHKFYIATSDCTGHGVPGAFMSLLNINFLNENVVERGIYDPAKILNEQRKEIINALNPKGTENSKDGMDCVLCAFDLENHKLDFAGANNPVWLIRDNKLIEYKGDKMPVGKHNRDQESFNLKTIDLQKGDVIYTLTDGFSDQFGGPNGKKFMSKNLKALLLTNAHLPMTEQKILLETTFKNWVGNLEQVDDVTLIGVRI